MSVSVRPGQVWRSNDRRDNGKKVRVVGFVDDIRVQVEVIDTGRKSRMQQSTLLQRYRLYEDAP